ncbi:hypothetical protein LXL04_001434 [Taraxacum kok-saghyz]
MYKAPVQVINSLESCRSRFFWAGGDCKKISWIKWSKVLNNKAEGGLNIRSLKAMNLALLAKCLMTLCLNSGDPRFCNWIWDPDKKRGFSVNSMRKLLDGDQLQNSPISTIWCKLVPIKANVFVWRARLNRLPTRLNLERRGVFIQSPNCPWCHSTEETSMHVFVGYRTARELLASTASWNGMVFEGKVKTNMQLLMEIKTVSFTWIRSRGSKCNLFEWTKWAYMTQEQVLTWTLTVKEAVYYSSELQLPKFMPKSEKKERADRTISEMGLQDCVNTRIGGWGLKDFIAKLTRQYHMTVVAAIHQPSSNVFGLFNNLCLVSSGRTIYFGPTFAANQFFAANGFPCQDLQNPADHYLITINIDTNEPYAISSTPYLFVISLIPGAISYSMMGLQREPERFIYFSLVLFVSMLLVESLMMIVATIVPNFLMGIITGAGIQGLMILAAGLFRLSNELPHVFWRYPMYYISFHRYALQGLYKNEFEGLKFPEYSQVLQQLMGLFCTIKIIERVRPIVKDFMLSSTSEN